MRKLKLIDKISNNLIKAFLLNKTIKPIPSKYAKDIKQAQKIRKLCESKINLPIVGFKAGGTAFPLLKKLGEKEPFYAAIYKNNLLTNGSKVNINKYTLGIELEVCFLLKKESLLSKTSINMKNIKKYITHMSPCIEIVGYRQRKKGIKYLGDLCSDFGGSIKFINGTNKKFKSINFNNLKTIISNKKINQTVSGNTKTVYINPLNSCKFVLNKLRNDKIQVNKSFYIFTGSTVGIVPIMSTGLYQGRIDKIGSVNALIRNKNK